MWTGLLVVSWLVLLETEAQIPWCGVRVRFRRHLHSSRRGPPGTRCGAAEREVHHVQHHPPDHGPLPCPCVFLSFGAWVSSDGGKQSKVGV